MGDKKLSGQARHSCFAKLQEEEEEKSKRSREPFVWHIRLLGGATRARLGSARPVISVAAWQQYSEISNLSADTQPAQPFGFLLPKHSRPLLPTSPPPGSKLKKTACTHTHPTFASFLRMLRFSSFLRGPESASAPGSRDCGRLRWTSRGNRFGASAALLSASLAF